MRVSLEKAAEILLQGQTVAIPTETVYGLAASFHHPEAIQQIFQKKNRPLKNPLILHVADTESVKSLTHSLPTDFQKLADFFWPGPLTLVLSAKIERIPPLIRANLSTQAFRMPKHPLALALIKKTGPLVAPSANISGRPSSVLPKHIEEDFGEDFPLLDGGPCQLGVESTILIFQDNQWKIGRLGAIPASLFEPILHYIPVLINQTENPACPGQMYRHYAPKGILNLKTRHFSSDVVLGYSDRHYPLAKSIYYLGGSNEPEEVLKNLYVLLRQLDENQIAQADVDIDVKAEGLWLTFLERIQKASQS